MNLRIKMIEAANEKYGGFVCTDGEWCSTRTPEEFRAFIESQGFDVVKCISTLFSTAIAITADGYRFAWNGFCTKLK